MGVNGMTCCDYEWWVSREGIAHAQDPASRYPQEGLCGYHERSGPVNHKAAFDCPECTELTHEAGA